MTTFAIIRACLAVPLLESMAVYRSAGDNKKGRRRFDSDIHKYPIRWYIFVQVCIITGINVCHPLPAAAALEREQQGTYTRAVPQIELPTLLWLSIYPYRVVLDRNNLHVFHSGISITNRAIYHQDDIKCTLTYHRSNEDEM